MLLSSCLAKTDLLAELPWINKTVALPFPDSVIATLPKLVYRNLSVLALTMFSGVFSAVTVTVKSALTSSSDRITRAFISSPPYSGLGWI